VLYTEDWELLTLPRLCEAINADMTMNIEATSVAHDIAKTSEKLYRNPIKAHTTTAAKTQSEVVTRTTNVTIVTTIIEITDHMTGEIPKPSQL